MTAPSQVSFVRRRVLAHATVAAASGLARPTFSQSSKPLRIVVGYSAGGGVDAIARLIAPALGAALDTTAIVENRPGASSVIAAETVSRSTPDGLTLMLADSALLVGKLLNPNQSFDWAQAMTPIAGCFALPLLVVGSPQIAANSPQSLLALLRSNPGKYSYATSGIGTIHHLGFEMFKHASRTFVVHVPYRGASQIIPDVAGGQIPLGVVSAAAGFAQAKGGKIKALACMSAAPPSGMEVVEPLSRVVPGFDIAPQLFFMGPASLTSEFATRIERALVQVCSAPAIVSAAANLGAVRGWSGQPLHDALQQESARFSRIIKEQRIKADS